MIPDISLSILIPTYRRPSSLKQCIQSIIDSGLRPLEVIIGDDGGDEDTIKVCKNFADVLPIIYLPPQSGKGSLPSNITRLIIAGKGNWTLLLHDDDFLTGDHTNYPSLFAEYCDFHFTDHWIADDDGVINESKSKKNSQHYGRNELKTGLQNNVFDLAYNNRVCLDGFYVKSSLVKSIVPDPLLGSTSDYFWMFRLLNCGMRIHYLSKRTFAYRISSVGITSSGFDIECILEGYKGLLKDFPQYQNESNLKISSITWHAINQCIRNGQKDKARRHLRNINFQYKHSIKHQILIILQLIWLTLPSGIVDRVKGLLWKIER